MENLPPEVIISVLEKCDSDDLGAIQLYCSSWASVMNDDVFFLKMFRAEKEEIIWRKEFPNYPRLAGQFSKNLLLLSRIRKYRYVIFCANRLREDSPIFAGEIATVISAGGNPMLNIADFERYLYNISAEFPRISLVKFLDYMIELHNWPSCFEGYSTQFPGEHGVYWKTICDALTRQNFMGVLEFLEKYKTNIIWNTRELYRYLDEGFLVRNKDIWHKLDWSSILVKVQLNESILENILEVCAQREQWYGFWPNIAYMTAHQQMSEEFIEKWFVGTIFDNSANWNNILRCQHISAAFKDKHEHKARRTR